MKNKSYLVAKKYIMLFAAMLMCCIFITMTANETYAAQAKWKTENGKKVYVLANGKKASGLTKVGNNYYYFKKGVWQKGWKTVSKKKYYFDPKTGKAVNGIKTINKKVYIFSKKRLTTTGLYKIGEKTYYSYKGRLKTGLVKYKNKTYYSTKSGLATGLQKIKDKTGKSRYYYFNKKTFVMVTNKTVGGRYFGPNGYQTTAPGKSDETTPEVPKPSSGNGGYTYYLPSADWNTTVSVNAGKTRAFEIQTEEVGETIDPNITFHVSNDCAEITSQSPDFGTTQLGYGYAYIKVRAIKSGTATLTAKSGNKTIATTTIQVIGTDTDYVDYLNWRKDLEAQLWTANMSAIDKIEAIGNYIFSNYTYLNANNSIPGYWYKAFSNGGGVNCTGAAQCIIDVAQKDLNLQAELFTSTGSTWPGHDMAKVQIGNKTYLVDATPPETHAENSRGYCSIREYNTVTFIQEATQAGFIGN